jgi:DNA replication protein DnaC
VTAFRYCQMPAWEQAGENPYAIAPALVLDDLGREPQDRRGQVEELLIGRWGDGLPTIVTSNLEIEALAERYDGRLIDRFQEQRSEVVVTDERLRPGGA